MFHERDVFVKHRPAMKTTTADVQGQAIRQGANSEKELAGLVEQNAVQL
jgi:hypothetical protein